VFGVGSTSSEGAEKESIDTFGGTGILRGGAPPSDVGEGDNDEGNEGEGCGELPGDVCPLEMARPKSPRHTTNSPASLEGSNVFERKILPGFKSL